MQRHSIHAAGRESMWFVCLFQLIPLILLMKNHLGAGDDEVNIRVKPGWCNPIRTTTALVGFDTKKTLHCREPYFENSQQMALLLILMYGHF